MAEDKKPVKEEKKGEPSEKKVSQKKAKPREGGKPDSRRKIKNIYTTGKRKRSVARISIRPGKGVVKVNSRIIENEKNDVYRLRIQEPLLVSGADWKKYDFNVKVRGGGIMGQADAVRQAISRGLVEIFGQSVRERLMDYDRNILVYDPRQTEPHKPPRSSQGPRRYKQRSKR